MYIIRSVQDVSSKVTLMLLPLQEGMLKNVSNDLESIWISGKYILSVPAQAGKECQLKLSFGHFHQQDQTSEWGQEQINDFVQKLGFLQDSADLEKVENFRIITKVCKL